MGYRYRLGKVSKKDHEEKFKGKTYEELKKNYKLDDDSFPLAYPPEYTELYELGKYFEMNYDCSPFYAFDIKEHDYDFWIMEKTGLEKIIAQFHTEIKKYYEIRLKIVQEETLSEQEQQECGIFFAEENIQEKLKNAIIHHFSNKVSDWSLKFGLRPYSLDKEKDLIQSWSYEYVIFQLVEIYRNFDWENDYLIYSAW